MCDLGNFIPKTISTVSSVLRLLKEGSVTIRAITYVKQELLAWDILEGSTLFTNLLRTTSGMNAMTTMQTVVVYDPSG